MKSLWLIERASAGYDEYRGHVIQARSESHARKIAGAKAADEGADVWLDPYKSNALLLTEKTTLDGSIEIVLSDFNAG